MSETGLFLRVLIELGINITIGSDLNKPFTSEPPQMFTNEEKMFERKARVLADLAISLVVLGLIAFVSVRYLLH